MSKRYSIVDDWGNVVRDWVVVPAGGGCLDSLGLVVVLLVFAAVGLFFYAIYRLIVDGIEEAEEGNWAGAFSNWRVIIVLTIAAISLPFVRPMVLWISETNASNAKSQYQAQQNFIATEIASWTKYDQAISLKRDGVGKYRISASDRLKYIELTISAWGDSVGNPICDDHNSLLKGGESIIMNCNDEQTLTAENDIFTLQHWENPKLICISAVNLKFGISSESCIDPFSDQPSLPSFVTMKAWMIAEGSGQRVSVQLTATDFKAENILLRFYAGDPSNPSSEHLFSQHILKPNSTIVSDAFILYFTGPGFLKPEAIPLCVEMSSKGFQTSMVCRFPTMKK